ncbi:hypothetical protein GCM10007962_08550 [Yeosuana aromativorans]|uniref:Uncharacterized protein n=1 Tax=Yeosuana aromativorans TaxID=288019 RepID=A0A8J3BIF6_9FLAO|nr:hypothetical protein [Yeosuana aromativorans]GGK16507.1 hypothetical protein GCM10007962_08550 [Yeosuana aromativorans]
MKDSKKTLMVNNDIVNAIIRICFDANDFKHQKTTLQNENIKKVICPDEDIDESIDKILSSTSNKELIRNVDNAVIHVEGLIAFYKAVQIDIKDKSNIISVLYRLESKLWNLKKDIQKN